MIKAVVLEEFYEAVTLPSLEKSYENREHTLPFLNTIPRDAKNFRESTRGDFGHFRNLGIFVPGLCVSELMHNMQHIANSVNHRETFGGLFFMIQAVGLKQVILNKSSCKSLVNQRFKLFANLMNIYPYDCFIDVALTVT